MKRWGAAPMNTRDVTMNTHRSHPHHPRLGLPPRWLGAPRPAVLPQPAPGLAALRRPEAGARTLLAAPWLVAALLLGGCQSADPARPDGSHHLPDGVVLDAAVSDGGTDLDAAPDRPACDDGEDDDGDGLVDFPADPGCESAEDEDESNPPYCGLDAQGDMIPLRELPPTGHLVQTTENGASHYAGSCGGDGGQELIFQIEVQAGAGGLVISTESPDSPPITQIDTVIHVRRDTCDDAGAEVACAAADPGEGGVAVALQDPAPGTYFVFVDTAVAGQPGQFLLTVRGLIPLGGACDPSDQTMRCAPGLICESPSPGDPTECLVPYCADGLDNDGDGLIDFPEEPGCESELDHDEQDGCPGPGCPQCADGLDNDGDGLTDWPQDPGCGGAGDDLELDECVPGLVPTPLPPSGQDSGPLTASDPSLTAGSCNQGHGPEAVYPLSLPHGAARVTATVDTFNYSAMALYLRQQDCADGTELACSAGWDLPRTLQVHALPPGDYYLFVDAEDLFQSDTYDLSVSVELPLGAPCAAGDPLRQCAAGGLCQDPGGGTHECVATACHNGLDDDGDGWVDYPFEPGCDDLDDDDESDACATTPSQCPACLDGVDNDGDGLVDYPADPGCRAASDTAEPDECTAGVPFSDLTATGDGSGLAPGSASAFTSSCGGDWYGEDVYLLRLPGPADRVSIESTSPLDSFGDPEILTVLYARQGVCDQQSAEIGCRYGDWGTATNLLELQSVPAGPLYLFVDADYVNNAAATYDLSVSATLVSGASCVPSAAAIACPAGTSCVDPGAGYVCQ
jgi:hypothetical protein